MHQCVSSDLSRVTNVGYLEDLSVFAYFCLADQAAMVKDLRVSEGQSAVAQSRSAPDLCFVSHPRLVNHVIRSCYEAALLARLGVP